MRGAVGPALLAAGAFLSVMAVQGAALAVDATEITAPGPQGHLAGTLLRAGDRVPVVLIIPGSGPTDRDGNSPLGITASTYRMIAEELAERGISSVRVDKRGMFGSTGAVSDANAVTVADYASDVHSWIATIRARTGAGCVFVLGHSEGALVALEASRKSDGICGLLLVSGPGRPLGDILRAQLRANAANTPYLPEMLAAIETLEGGGSVDVSALHPVVAGLFAPSVQPFLRDVFSRNPAAMIADVDLPVLILQGETDLQTRVDDARLLAAANPAARLAVIERANHVLKSAPGDDLQANLATYTNPDLPLADGVIEAIAGFVRDAMHR